MANPLATLVIAVTSDTKGLVSGFNIAAVAVGAFAAKSIAAAVEFDRSMTKVAAISNTSADAIGGMSEEVIKLAGETAQAPTELADALFFLASAGLDAADVMPALEASAKASAVGLGETADVANIVASALNAYSKTGLDAAHATDILVAAVREGRAEPEEFANALGRILPIASTVGVTFDQVAASMAVLSNVGLDVNEGVTSMRGVLQAIAAPGKQAAEAMDAIGVSSQQLLDVISEKGIVGALQLLETRTRAVTKGDAEFFGVLRDIVPNIRSLTGVLNINGQEAAKVGAIYDAVADSTGSLDDAFGTTAESSAFKLQKAFNDLLIAGQQVAGDALPGIASALNAVLPLLTQLAKNIDVLIGLMVAFKVGSIASAAGMAQFGAALGPIAGIIAGAVIAGRTLNDVFFGMDQSIDEIVQGLQGQLEPALEAGTISAAQYAAASKAMRDASFENVGVLLEVTAAIQAERMAQEAEVASKASAMTAAESYVGSLERQAAATGNAASEQINAAQATAAHTEALREQQAILLQLAGGLLGVVSSADQLQDAQSELNKLQEHGKRGTEEYRDASLSVLQATLQVKQGLAAYGEELIKNDKSGAQVVQTLTRLGTEAGLTKGDIRDLLGDVQGLTGDLKKLGQQHPKPSVELQDDATPKLASIKARLEELATDWTIRVHAAEVRGSPLPSELIAMLDEDLHDLTDEPWEVKIKAGLQPPEMLRMLEKDTKALDKVLDTLGSSIDDIRADLEELNAEEKKNIEKINELEASLDKLKDQRRAAKELSAAFSEFGRKLERLASQVQEFGDAIRSAFDIDLVGGMSDLLNQFNEAQAAFLAGTGEEPAALDLEGFLKDQVAGATAFAQALEDLQAAGLSQQNLQDLAAQGIDALPLAQALLGNPQLISALNDAAKSIAETAGNTTDALIEKEFGPAIDRLAERLKKLEHSLERFDNLIERITGHGGGRGGNGGGGGGGTAAAAQVASSLPPTVINVYGDVLTEGQLVDKIDEGLRRKRLRNGKLLSDV